MFWHRCQRKTLYIFNFHIYLVAVTQFILICRIILPYLLYIFGDNNKINNKLFSISKLWAIVNFFPIQSHWKLLVYQKKNTLFRNCIENFQAIPTQQLLTSSGRHKAKVASNYQIHCLERRNVSGTAWKVSVLGVILVRIFPHSNWIRTVFSPDAGNTEQNNSEYGHFLRRRIHQNTFEKKQFVCFLSYE